MRIGCIIKIGNIVEGLISIVTLGNGKDIAMFVAKKLGYESCGCEERRIYLNKITCKEHKDGIKIQ